MSSNPYEGQDPLDIAKKAEREINSYQAKQGLNNDSLSATESGVNESVTSKFPGASLKYGSAASGAGDNREIPVDEGGDLLSKSGEKAGQYVSPYAYSGSTLTIFQSLDLQKLATLKAPVDPRRKLSCMKRRTQEIMT
ncbi:MAG: hypothetical protein LQ351_005067 [Letrouitia transgressa]|nr:MAG: hypothetical protein LQ351_005067 [Letrouitia transgressa]